MSDCAAETRYAAPTKTLGERLRESPLLALLAHVRPHVRWAALTFAFGALGFALSFAYPWIIGAVVDLVTSPGAVAAREARLARLTELAALTAVLH
ncbi:MAG: hypothetical protein JOZ69_04130, partial [Myxococcales bacterium]|nr:hypothetical protein [Myxococcales bacterium]